MNDFGITETSWNLLLQSLASSPLIEKAVIFGSRAKGTHSRGSDIDIAIFGAKADEKTAMNLSAKLNGEVPSPYTFDVVSFESIDNLNLREHIQRAGKVIYQNKCKSI